MSDRGSDLEFIRAAHEFKMRQTNYLKLLDLEKPEENHQDETRQKENKEK